MEAIKCVETIIIAACETDIDLKNAVDTKTNKSFKGAYNALESYARKNHLKCISDSEALEIFKQYYFDEIEETEETPKPIKEPKKETPRPIKPNKNMGGQMSLFDI